jgi:signal transduction histidine kinase
MNPMKEGEKIVGIQCLIIDITDRENKEKQISNLAKFPSQNPNPVLRVDKAGKILYANKAADNYGFILDKKGTRYITKELKETITNSFNSGSSDTVELEIGSKTFSFVVAPIPNKDYVNIYGHEITESKKYEVLLEKTMNELIKINEKLSVVGKFTRHDTRNKLSVIANNIFLAKLQLAENHKAFEYLLNVESALDHIEKILSFTKTYEMLGVEKLSYQSVKKYIDAAANILDPNKVRIINTCEGLKVYADSLLRQMFYNLMDNSLKHGKTVTEIKISCEVFDESLKLIYEDNGIGIPENEKEKVFEKGYGKNTGLGLYIIEKICEAYDWTLREEGIPGKGARFTITIPKGKFKLKASESKTD